MDTSKEYILMCEKADEIQYLRPLDSEFQEGDFYGYYDEHHHYEGTYPDGKHIADWTSGIAYDDGEYGLPYKVSLWYKIKTMWHILRTGTPYRDQINISHADGLKLGNWLLEISQAQRYQEIEDFLDKKLDK